MKKFFYCFAVLLMPATALFPQSLLVMQNTSFFGNYEGISCAWVDYNNDGYMDIFFTDYNDKNRLLKNNGDGSFNFINAGMLTEANEFYCNNSWADYDNDGDMDVYVNKSSYSGNTDNKFYENKGNGVFELIDGLAITNEQKMEDVTWFDYNKDGYLDVYLSDKFNLNSKIFVSDSNKNFLHELDIYYTTYPAIVADYNNDNWPDILTTIHYGGFNYVVLIYQPDSAYPYYPSLFDFIIEPWDFCINDYNNDGFFDVFMITENLMPDDLYTNIQGDTFYLTNPGGQFTYPSFVEQSMGRTAAWMDYDNDGDEDMFIVCFWDPEFSRNIFYRNNGDGTFTDITYGQFVHTYGEAMAWADYDKNGFLDLFVTGIWTGNKLFKNIGNGNHWINIHLLGSLSNYNAIGAKVKAKSTLGWQYRQVLSRTSIDSQSSLNVHFGFGQNTTIDTLSITWPSDLISEYYNVNVDQFLTIVEPRIKLKEYDDSLFLVLPQKYDTNTTYQWFLNDQVIGGVTDHCLLVAENGEYKAVIDQGIAFDTTNTILIYNLHVKEKKYVRCDDVLLYPLPAHSNLMIACKKNTFLIESIILFDLNGNEIFKQNLPGNNQVRLDVSNCAPGMYFIQIRIDNNLIRRKVIIQ